MFIHTLIALFVAIIGVVWIHPRLVKIALLKNIVDNPDARKLQRTPVPVLGGVAVFFGIVLGLALSSTYISCTSLMTIVAAMMIMLYTGTMDDILDLSASLRLLVEIGVVLLIIYSSDISINNFHGLWGVYGISSVWAIPLTVFASVGIINAINMIDGVNGLSSGFCITASIAFGTIFYLSGNIPMLMLATVSVGSLLPFLFHNVFGKSSKMFIGDGGTLVMGVVMSVFVINVLAARNITTYYLDSDFGVIAFTLAVMAVPVFDTLRVMLSRILRGTSPFHPDKTHLHHLFIDMGFSHAGTTASIIFLNVFVVFSQWLTWHLGGSINLQLYVVVTLGILITTGLYTFMTKVSDNNPLKRGMKAIGRATRFERKGAFLVLQKLVDRA